MSVRVLLVDDHAMVRDGLRALLGEMGENFHVVGEASSVREAIAVARESSPNVALVDVELPGLGGAHLTKKLLDQHEDIRVIALSMHEERDIVQDMLGAGAHAYVLKRSGFQARARAMQRVCENRPYIDEDLVGTLFPQSARRDNKEADASDVSRLSLREREVLKLLADGFSTKAIAHELSIGQKTVDTHRRSIAQKLHTGNIADLTRIAIRHKLSRL